MITLLQRKIDMFTLNGWKAVEGYVKVLSSDHLPTLSMVCVIFGFQALLEKYGELHLYGKNLNK